MKLSLTLFLAAISCLLVVGAVNSSIPQDSGSAPLTCKETNAWAIYSAGNIPMSPSSTPLYNIKLLNCSGTYYAKVNVKIVYRPANSLAGGIADLTKRQNNSV